MTTSVAADLDSEERDNFFRLTLLLFRLGNTKLREFLKSKWPTVHHNANGTMPTSWSDIPTDATALKNIVKLRFQFKKQEKNFDSGNTNEWDFSLLSLVLLSRPYVAVSSAVQSKALKDMKEIRNNLIGHAPDAKIPKTVFTTEWTKACKALEKFNATQEEFDAVEEDLEKPVEYVYSILKECCKMEEDILKVVTESETKADERHKEVMGTLSDQHEEILEKLDSLKTCNEERDTEPRASKNRRLQMRDDQQVLLQQRFPYFQDKVTAAELLEYLPCLTDEQKDQIQNDEKTQPHSTAKGLKPLVEKLEEHEEGFEQFVHALCKAGLGHVALLLDADCSDSETDGKETKNEDEDNYFIFDGSVADIRIMMRITEITADEENKTQPDLEKQVATAFSLHNSPECKELRREFQKVLPKGVYFVHTKIFNDSSGGVRVVFRVAKTDPLNKLWKLYQEKVLENLLKTQLVSRALGEGSHGENNQNLKLEIQFLEKDFKAVKRILEGSEILEEPETTSEETVVDEAMETEPEAAVLPEKSKRIVPRPVYLDDGNYNLSRKLKLRDYQKELAAPAFEGKNTIICAPTNSGKTFVAMEIAKRHLDAYKDNTEENDNQEPKVIFVVDKQNLVLQQKGRFEEYLTNYSTSDITGADSEAQNIPLNILLGDNDVVVLTAQILVNALKDKSVRITDISLLVFDECHHANKNHPYNQIMQVYLDLKINGREAEKLPQVIGLTASLGVGQSNSQEKAKDHILQMCANLDASNISTVRENVEDLERNVTGNVPEIKRVQVQNVPNIFEEEINKAMKEIEDFIQKNSSASPPQATNRQNESYRQWIELLENNASLVKNKDQFTCATQLRRYHEALLINNFVRIEDGMRLLDEYFNNLDRSKFTETCSWLQNLFLKTKERIEEHIQETGQSENPLLKALRDHILGIHAKSIEAEAKGILFTRTRDYAFALKRWMEETERLKDVLRPEVLLGSEALTKNQQDTVIQKLKDGEVNVIIATTVAEEGLDIPTGNYVIRYGVKGNEISSVQSRGRIRAEGGEYVHLSDAKSKGAEHERRNQYKEMLMNSAVDEVRNIVAEEFIKKIEGLQIDNMRVLKKKQELEAMKKSKLKMADGVTFYCKKCNAMVCHAQDLRRFAEVHHVVINRDIHERIDIKPHEKPSTHDNIYFGKKIYCKKCGHDWGVIITIEGSEFPCLKIVSFVTSLNHGKQRKLLKKWKDLPFKICEAKLEEMIEEQEIAMDEDDYDGQIEKEVFRPADL